MDGREFSYDFWYDTMKKEYPYEEFKEILKDQYGNEKEVVWLLKDSVNSNYQYENEELTKMIPLVSQSNLLVYLVDTSKFKYLEEMKELIVKFASKVDIVDMNNIPMERTINLMKNKNDLQKKLLSLLKMLIFIWMIMRM